MKTNGLDLSAIPGLGPARRAALQEAGVQDLQGLLTLRVAELAAIRGIGLWQARRIREFLRQRGLLVETEDEDGTPITVVIPHTPEEARVVDEIAHVMVMQEQAEATLEQEVEKLSEAVASAQATNGAAPSSEGQPLTIEVQREAEVTAAPEDTGAETLPESGEASDATQWTDIAEGHSARTEDDEDVSPSDKADDEDEESVEGTAGAREALRAQRDQLPDVALVLMEAIRQAAVTKQLTRQITRLLITSGEFVSREKTMSAEAYLRAQSLVAEAERLLHRAVEKAAFDVEAQKDLASRIRKRRKELEAMLESEKA